MSLTFLYRDLDATDTDITEFVVLRFGANPQGMAENAEERSVGAWDLQIEDDGVLDLHAQRTFYVFEDDTYDGDPVLWVGQTFDKHNGRGDTYRTGTGRVYTLSLVDLNTLLERRVIKSTDDPDRPEETDVERMLWLEGTGYIGLGTWISSDDPVDMDAVDYTGRMAAEVAEDCMGQSGKNAFMFRDPDTGGFSTFYGDSSADIDVLTSDIRISNVLADIDEVTTWEALLDADLWEANSRIYSGVFANYDGGAIYQENAVTVANFSHRDTTVSWPDVKTSAKANGRATRYLNDIGTEEYRITVNIEVPSTSVGFMPHAGYRLQARFSHYPKFTEFTWMRILSRATTLILPNRYRIQYELSPGTPPTPAIACSDALTARETWEGHFFTDAEGGPSGWVSPRADNPADPGSTGLMIGVWVARRIGDVMGTADTISVSGDYTEIRNNREGSVDPWQTASAWAYFHTTSDGGTMSCAWSANPASTYQFFSVFLPVSSTAPVQKSSLTDGATVIFPAPVTAGNILIAWAANENAFSGPPAAPDGWTYIDGVRVDGDWAASLWARCATAEDGDTFTLFGSSFSHWGCMIEVAP